jgi:hypothetical protein
MSGVSHHEKKMKRTTVTIERRGRRYSFDLCHRPIELGPHATIEYWWMDLTEFRNLGSNQRVANYYNCLQHWWESMQLQGENRDLDQQIHYVFAQAYPLFCRSKKVQDIYRDAFLRKECQDSDDVSDCLPDEDCERIADVVRSRDRDRVKAELDSALQRDFPPAQVVPALREACRHWVGNGVVLWRAKGHEGLQQWLNGVEHWAEKYRHRRGVKPLVRHFVSMFAYEAKISFYTCFANAWTDIIPVLRKRHGLDLVSERFLRMWHNQNQAVEIPHGRTREGIVYPTSIRYELMVPSSRGHLEPRRISVPTLHIGPTHIPDVFSGQVLSLHPLSGFFMKDASLRAKAGRFFASRHYDHIVRYGQEEYWELVGAILIAANLYRRAADEQENNRGRFRRGEVDNIAAGCGDATSETMLFEDFAISQKITCPHCHASVCYRAYEVMDDGRVRLNFECSGPEKHPVTRAVEGSTLKDWLLRDQK